MVGTLSVKIAAHNPSFPLEPVFTFVNSAQSFRLLNVPRKIGKWDITKVFVNLNYPDNTTIQKECVLNGNIWIGTVEGCAESGTSTNGFIVTASGIDEDGNAVSNYVLGAGDLYVKDLDGTIDPERVGTKMYFNDALPENPKKGDATFIDGVLNVYDGANWVPVAESPDPSFIIDADGNKIEADRTSTWRTKSSWFISSLNDGEITFDPPLECAWEQISYRDSGEDEIFHKWMWISKSPYAYGLYIGIDPDLTYVEYYYKDGDIYEVGSGDVISSHTENSITAITDIPCSITRTSEWSEQTGKLALKSDLPTKTSDLTNDSGFITTEEVLPYHNPLTPTVNTGLADKAYSLALIDLNGLTILDGQYIGTHTLTRDLKDEFIFGASIKTYWPYVMSMFNGQTYDPPLELKFCKDTLIYMSGGRPRVAYTGYMFRTGGAGFAIPCSEDGTPAGTLYKTTAIDTNRILVSSGTPYTIGFTQSLSDPYGQITSLDGEPNITAYRNTNIKTKTVSSEVANKSDLPTKTSDLTNDSGFATETYVDNIVGDINSALDAINGEVI